MDDKPSYEDLKGRIEGALKEIDDFYNSGMYGEDGDDNANRMRSIIQRIKNILDEKNILKS